MVPLVVANQTDPSHYRGYRGYRGYVNDQGTLQMLLSFFRFLLDENIGKYTV